MSFPRTILIGWCNGIVQIRMA